MQGDVVHHSLSSFMVAMRGIYYLQLADLARVISWDLSHQFRSSVNCEDHPCFFVMVMNYLDVRSNAKICSMM